MLDRVFSQLVTGNYSFEVSRSLGTAGAVYIISAFPPYFPVSEIPVKLAVDVFDDKDIAKLKKLRLSISSEFAAEILKNHDIINRFTDKDKDIPALQFLASQNVPCLKVSLLRNRILDQFDEVKHGLVKYFVKKHELDKDFLTQIDSLSPLIRRKLVPDKETSKALHEYSMDDDSDNISTDYDF
jgi:hypothetical protein